MIPTLLTSKVSISYISISKLSKISLSSYISQSTTSSSSIVVHGDALDRHVYQKLHLDPKPNCLITDPPYCILTRRRVSGELRDPKQRKRKIDDDETITRFENVNSYKKFTQQWLDNVITNCLCKEQNQHTIIIWTNPLGKKSIRDVVQNDFGYTLVGEYVWGKRSDHKSSSSINSSKETLVRIYETALIFKKDHVNVPLLPNDKGFQWSVITGYHDENDTVHEHPCHKPFKSIEPLIRNFTKPKDSVIDPFAGSGSILKCAQIIGQRKVYGLEKLEKWVTQCNDILK